MAGLFTALGTISVLALVAGLVLLIINAIRRKPVRFWAFLMIGSFVLAIGSASVGAASRTTISQEATPLSSEINPIPPLSGTGTVTASSAPLPLPIMPKTSLAPKIAPTPTPASPTPLSTKEKYRPLTKEETAWALSIQPKNRPNSRIPSWVTRRVGAYNSWYEEELYSRPPLKPPVEQQGVRRYTLIVIKQTGMTAVKVGQQEEYIAKGIEVLLKVEALGERPAQAEFDDFRLLLAKPEFWPTGGYVWGNLIFSDFGMNPEPGYIRGINIPVKGVLPANVSWWPKGGLDVELFYGDRLDGDPFQGTPFQKAKEGIARLDFNIHIDTNITQKGAYLTNGSFVKDHLQAQVAFELDGLSEYLQKRD